MSAIVAFGNPLLDTVVTLPNEEILKKYNLNRDDQREVGPNDMKSLRTDIKRFKCKLSPGGCAQNTLRVIQWLFRRKCSTIIYGSVGRDEEGQMLRDLLEADGVQTRYFEQKTGVTGNTVALINGVHRALVAHLGAAEVLSLDTFKSDPSTISDIEHAELIYMEGFFLTKRLEVARHILELSANFHKPFAFNLSGKYLCELEPDNVKYFAKRSDILFGNRDEFKALAKLMRINLIELLEMYGEKGKIVVVTNGARSVTVVHSGGIIEEVDVPLMDETEIVDTTGAGDAFVAGFLTGLLLRRTPVNCAELGSYAAQEVIMRYGCTLPRHPPSVLL